MEPTEKKVKITLDCFYYLKRKINIFERGLKKLGREKRGNKNKFLFDISYQSEATEEIFLTCVINFMIFEQQSKNHYSCIFLHTIPVEFTS